MAAWPRERNRKTRHEHWGKDVALEGLGARGGTGRVRDWWMVGRKTGSRRL